MPIAIGVTVGWYGVQYGKDKETARSQKIWSCIFVCYLAGLVCLTLFLDVAGIVWYRLLYHMDSGRRIRFFGGGFRLIPDFYRHINREVIGNVLMFLPFGILYPMSHRGVTWRKAIHDGLVCVVVIEMLQPVFGRAFDINDILLNSLGIACSTGIFFLVKKAYRFFRNRLQKH
ncbi:MAG: VanZ family protein [Clostridium sp.]|nr:VanZ family protein [Clostridium sp.]